MELYTLDSLLRRTAVIDLFESLIWTERYSSWGDFELLVFSTPEMRRLLPTGTRLALSHSYRVMEVELVEDSTNDDGTQMLKISGRSLEKILEERLARNTFADLTTTPKWILTGTPGDIVRQIFNTICRTNVLMAEDEIPFLQTGTLFPPSTNEEPDGVITIELEPKSVYDAIKEICDVYDLGFRLVRNFDESELYFDVYSGNNRTTSQNVLAPVVFAPNLDNLTNISEISSISDYRNVAYVLHKNGFQIVYADGTASTVEGFERRVLNVDASDIDLPAGPALDAALLQRGKEALANARPTSALDGELPMNSPYPYEIAYALGDLIEMRNVDGVTNRMRVIEQIFVSDAQGERAYPTLAIDLFITPGSWLSWSYNETWLTVDGTWGEAD